MKVKIDIPFGAYIGAQSGYVRNGGIVAQNIINAVAAGEACGSDGIPTVLDGSDMVNEMTHEIVNAMMKEQEVRKFKELKEQGYLQPPVLLCNRENKAMLKELIPQLCILGTDCCDDKIYMVTNNELADNIRDMLKFDCGESENGKN